MTAKWNHPTPSGFVYTMPRSVAEIKYQEVNCARASIQNLSDLEAPPEPTWEMVAILLDEIERILIATDAVRVELLFQRPADRPGGLEVAEKIIDMMFAEDKESHDQEA